MTSGRVRGLTGYGLLWLGLLSVCCHAGGQASATGEPVMTLRATARRVVVDVVVTDKSGKPVAGLQQSDFAVFDDGDKQRVLSFEASGFHEGMDFIPPAMAPLGANNFVNLPKEPEKGPLYVLLYDLVNFDKTEDQIFARQQLMKFVKEKPEGTRFAIFMLSDGMHLIQGFTSDKQVLYAALDPKSPHSHIPRIFLMGVNFGQGDPGTAMMALNYLASYLEGLPGRKNVIWVSGGFPLTLFANELQSDSFIAEVKKTLDVLQRSQIALYPVDARGVQIDSPHAPAGNTGGGGIDSDARDTPPASAGSGPAGGGAPTGGGSGAAGSAPAGASASGGVGINTLLGGYAAADEIAKLTGGRAFYSTNDVTTAIEKATADGASYYTLSYSPSNRAYDDKRHAIRIAIEEKGYSLAYRRAYYSLDPNAVQPGLKVASKAPAAGAGLQPVVTPVASVDATPRKVGDSLSANMQHGAPIAHGLLFGAHVQMVGDPAMATPEQMAALSDEPSLFTKRRRNAVAKPRTPVKLQRYLIRYTVLAKALKGSADAADGGPNLELAAAAYDKEGVLLNGRVMVATREGADAAPEKPSYRVEQELLVPAGAISIRIAMHDRNTDRIGAMEIGLPLAAEAKAALQ